MDSNYIAYKCIKRINLGTFNGAGIDIRLNAIVLFDGETIEILEPNYMEFNNRIKTPCKKRYFMPRFQLAIDAGHFIPDPNYRYAIELEDEGIQIGNKIKTFNFTGSGVTATIDGLDPEKVNVNIPGGSGFTSDIRSSSGVYSCPIGVSVGDVVFVIGSNTVDYADSSDVLRMPAFGVVVNKPTGITATVVYAGELDLFSGLIPGNLYFTSTLGTITDNPTLPSNIVQKLGMAVTATKLILDISQPIMLKI